MLLSISFGTFSLRLLASIVISRPALLIAEIVIRLLASLLMALCLGTIRAEEVFEDILNLSLLGIVRSTKSSLGLFGNVEYDRYQEFRVHDNFAQNLASGSDQNPIKFSKGILDRVQVKRISRRVQLRSDRDLLTSPPRHLQSEPITTHAQVELQSRQPSWNALSNLVNLEGAAGHAFLALVEAGNARLDVSFSAFIFAKR